jgi:hypothetical protein
LKGIKMFHADSMYVKGHSHRVCQDYAAHNEMGAAISDGCSSSKDTDIGARLIVRDMLFGEGGANIDRMYWRPVPLFSKEMFDATYLEVRYSEGDLWTKVLGDGVVAIRDMDGDLWIYESVYPSGYPEYMSYQFDSDRMELWRSATHADLVVNVFVNGTKFDDTSYCSQVVRKALCDTKSIAVFSDGVESFTDKEGNKISVIDVVTELMAFKNIQGEFVTRRMSRFLKDCEKRGWSHYDDLSMAAIVVDR